MKIGLITGEYPPMEGGVGAYSRELARALNAQGHTVYVLTASRVPSDASAPAIHVTGSVRHWNSATIFGAVRRWASDHQIDVVNIQYEAAAFHMAQSVHFLPRLLHPIPTVTTFHDLLVPYLFPKAGRLRIEAIHTLAKASAGVIATNVQDESRLRSALPQLKVANIPIGSNITPRPVSAEERAAWRTRLNIPAGVPVVGYFGFLNATKGVDTLLEALADPINAAVHTLLIGGRTGASDPTNAASAESIDTLIARLKLVDRVHETGFIADADVSAAFAVCDVVALPFTDGVSLRRGSFMAALAHGCAIITTTPQVPIPEIENGVQARLVPPGSVRELAQAVREVVADSALRTSLQENAQALAACFTWEDIAIRTATFLQSCLSHQPQ